MRPIREIEKRARQLGEGDLQGRIALSTGDELEALGGQFNRMAERLQKRRAGGRASPRHARPRGRQRVQDAVSRRGES